MTPLRRRTLTPVAVGFGAALLVAGVGSTMTDLGPWYRGLRQPDWSPPDWAFPIGWTTIYVTTVIGGIAAWRCAQRSDERMRLVTLFAFNAFLNILWSLLFFRLHHPDWALIEVVPFWLSIVALIVTSRRSPTAWLWLLPYLFWVVFAGALNAAVVALNPPF
jgi:benzodiazapine receptor